jgi:1-acyl-sn-glycerol-3-phosphate acyltransferase
MQAEDYRSDQLSNPAPFTSESEPAEPGSLSPAVRTILSIWTWTEITLVSITTFVLAAMLTVLLGAFDRKRIVVGHIVRLGAVAAVKLNPLWKFSVAGNLPRPRPKRVVCVSNHCSHTDSFLISHLPWNVRWLAKASLFRIPFLGWAMWLSGDVAVVRGKAQSAKDAMKRCGVWLDRGIPIMIFPEGTRALGGDLLPFKDGAFRLAIEAEADVLPLAVAGTRTALRKHDWRAGYSRGVLTVGAPISTKGMTLEDVPRLKEMARKEILRLRDQVKPLATE